MVQALPTPTLDSGVILTQAAKQSAFQLGGVVFSPAPNSSKFFTTHIGDQDFREHEYGDAQRKTAVDTPVEAIDVHMVSLYVAEWFSKDEYSRSDAAKAITASYSSNVPLAIDRYLATELPKRYWQGFQGTPAEQDGSAEKFLAAQDALSAAGFNPNLSVWDAAATGVVRSILNENTARSDAAVSVVDGTSVSSTVAYFRRLYGRALADGNRIGQILDATQTRVFLRQTPGLVLIDNDVEAQERNGIYAKLEFQIGIASVPGSAIPLTYEAGA